MEKLNELAAGIKSGKLSASWVAVDSEHILTIAEAFRALEQRAEAAQAKLAERNKQRNPDYFLNRIESSDKWGPEAELRIYESQLDASKSQDDHGGGIIELFTRPVPAAGLAALVPDAKAIRKEAGGYAPVYSLQEQQLFIDGATWLRAATLRNIEEAK